MSMVTAEHKTKANKKIILIGKHLSFSCAACVVASFQVPVITKNMNFE